MSHLSGEVKRLMSMLTKYDQDNYPEMLGRICIINAPMVFKAIWALVKPLLNPRTLSKIQVRVQGAQCQGVQYHRCNSSSNFVACSVYALQQHGVQAIIGKRVVFAVCRVASPLG